MRTRRLLLTPMQLGVYVIPFLPLYVSTSLLFPYVTAQPGGDRRTVGRMLDEKKGGQSR